MKKINFVLLLIVGMIFAFSGSAFADTSLADVQAKLTAAKTAGVTTLADVQAQLREAKNRQEILRIERIARNFGTSELHALKLTKGNTIGDIAKVVSTKGFLGIGRMVTANGLTMGACKNLRPGFIFYIPTSMIKKELILNAYEVALLRQDLNKFKEMAKRLTGENEELTAVIAEKESVIKGLTSELKIEKDAHTITAGKLVDKDLLSSRLGEKANTLETKSLKWMIVTYTTIIVAILLLFCFFIFRNGKKDKKMVEKVIKEYHIKKDTPIIA